MQEKQVPDYDHYCCGEKDEGDSFPGRKQEYAEQDLDETLYHDD